MMNRGKTLSFRAKSSSSRARKLKACRGRELGRDWISELPDEIKVHILSLLTMKEAGQTSVLSKRWINVWAYIPVLNFDDPYVINKLRLHFNLVEVEKPFYVRWVNQVVDSYKGSTIDEFRVQFDLSVTSGDSIDKWVKFAMEKKVKRLELDFTTQSNHLENRIYNFRGLSMCSSLISLRLAVLNVTDEVFQSLLQSCPSLEYLSVECSTSLRNVKVTGAAVSLKYLEIIECFVIEHIEISAPNLVSFTYFGPKVSMPFRQIPSLAKLSIGGKYGDYVTNNFLELTSYLIQLEALKLAPSSRTKDVMKSVDQFPQCNKLKQLEVGVCPEIQDDLFCFAPLIKACPFLHKFVLKINWWNCVVKRELLKIEDCPHYHLKILEIEGFVGHAIDLEFIMYLLKNCVALKKIVINPCCLFGEGSSLEFEANMRKKRARKKAEKLRKMLKHGAELIIL